MKHIALFLLALTLLPAPVRAQSYDEWWQKEYGSNNAVSSGLYDEDKDQCSGYHCRNNDKEKVKEDNDNDRLQNSFQNQGPQKNSIGSMVTNQLQPR